ncbi:MAG: hypothetical protein AAGJ97_12135 [Planctomycetota bacterium]
MSSVLDTSTASVFDPVPAPTHLDVSSAGLRMTPAEYDAIESWDRSFRFELVLADVLAEADEFEPPETSA